MSEPKSVYDRHYLRASEALKRICASARISASELVFALSFVLNFVVGKLLHVFSEHAEVYNYYNDKGNLFNQVFVKRGWGWTTVVLGVFVALQFWNYLQEVQGKAPRKMTPSAIVPIVLRWAIATLWWVLFTQWCFGLPIMDKFFVHTGGKCALIPEHTVSAFVANSGLHLLFDQIEDLYESRSISSYKCRRLKGSWEGGHDPLGHVFLLVHSSLFLFHEIKPFWDGWKPTVSRVRLVLENSSLSIPSKILAVAIAVPSLVVMTLIGLWWFMLLVTNMYFHSLAEKLVGLIFGFLGIAAVYYAPRWRKGTNSH